MLTSLSLAQESGAAHFCNVAAHALGLDPAGHARRFDDAILVETPLPWRRTLYERAGALPQEMIDLLALWLARYRQGQPYSHCPLLIAPDPATSRPGFRRVIFFRRPPGAFAHYTRAEYFVPEEEAGPLAWALYEAQGQLPRFDAYRLPEAPVGSPVRDLLVCTHGAVDAACGKFGYPLYRSLRDAPADAEPGALRVWRVSHFGGHVFAPTLLELPSGHFWAFVGDEQGAQIARRSGDAAALRGHYRGWAGAEDGFAQAAECAAWQREGWAWFDYAKSCTVTALDSAGAAATANGDADAPAPRWAEVRLDFTRPDGTRGAYAARVEAAPPVHTQPHTGRADAYAYPQYAVTRFEKCR